MSKTCKLKVASTVTVVILLFVFPLRTDGQDLPTRAFDIRNGSVRMQGGLIGSRDEIGLFMVLANKTQRTIWAEVEFRLSPSGKLLQGFEKLKKGKTQMYRWTISEVIWDTEYPFTVSVFEDKKRKKPLGTEESSFFFEGDEGEQFESLRGELQPNQATVINGFRELTSSSLTAEVKGTAADNRLQEDITRTLFAEESKLHKECEHKVIRAEPYLESDRSIIADGIGREAPELERGLRAKNAMWVEKWFVQSCKTVNIYEVLLLMEAGSKTTIMVQKLDSAMLYESYDGRPLYKSEPDDSASE